MIIDKTEIKVKKKCFIFFSLQVVFFTYPQQAMAWRYPQPRTLTRIHVSPVPFEVSHSTRYIYEINRSSFLPSYATALLFLLIDFVFL